MYNYYLRTSLILRIEIYLDINRPFGRNICEKYHVISFKQCTVEIVWLDRLKV